MAPLEPKPPDPRPLYPPFFLCSHGQILHFLKVTDTGLAFVQALILGSVPENVCFHGALGAQMLEYDTHGFGRLCANHDLQSSTSTSNSRLPLPPLSVGLTIYNRPPRRFTDVRVICTIFFPQAHSSIVFNKATNKSGHPLDLGECGKSFLDFLAAQPPKA
ncbi:hypothetical protein Cgig2_012006 [Carnegiea gigantea]|uniref:Uncharacterized protein n=1 Tax=Carnegiea gigantea TaxID=171969 RepID=A0A9Q1QND8_9CARY|nr:hypothetical protein Cgig2_012006 [Carnegiea gigantea]